MKRANSQEKAANYEHQSEVPQEFSPFPGVIIKYKITDLIWTKNYVLFQVILLRSSLSH